MIHKGKSGRFYFIKIPSPHFSVVKRKGRQATNWEKIFAKDAWGKGLLSQIYKELSNEKQTTWCENGPKTFTDTHFTKRETRSANKRMRMYCVSRGQEHTREHSAMPGQARENGCSLERWQHGTRTRMKNSRDSHLSLMGRQRGRPPWKKVWQFLTKMKHILTM